MSHHFKAGDRVSLAFGFHDQGANGTYAITRLLPTRMNGEPQYRVKGSDDRERVGRPVRSGAEKATIIRLPMP
ncbi:MAG TPA: hypothetical protein VGO06_03895 [Bosea sp. (in: a-proteobacteria)]|jgi:hypothetical protein|uniref:hypothetical protein n=1 Tax=Bosea sp. (in: a-proteobacteria) TaxID=1871050 RepID=UPI002E0FA120|nr:hypothetical protein [Bosea sp. (in: a-proteobacteria)]